MKSQHSGRKYIHDTKVPPLYMIVMRTGARSFYLYKKVRGVPERIFLGKFPGMTVEQARRKATVLIGQIATGKNPADQRREELAEWTLRELFDAYLAHAKQHKKTWPQDQSQFDRYLSRFASRKITGITKAQIKKLHSEIGARGPYAANRLLALVSLLFNYARRELDIEVDNPAQGIKRYREESRDRFLHAEELERFFQAVNAYPDDTVRDYLLICLLSGQRKGNVESMRWEELDLKQRTWRIPTTKHGEPHVVPLVPEAVRILNARNDHAAGPWVFPGTGKTGHLVEPKRAWNKILAGAEIENLRIHDLRRSMGSWMTAHGSSLTIVGKSLGHKSHQATQVYARLDLDPVRAAMETAAGAMLKAGKVRQPRRI
jgi:integrase